jgi:hypothetical protein
VTEHEEPQTGYDGASVIEEIRLLVELVVEHAAPWLDGVISAGHGPEQPTAPAMSGPAAGARCARLSPSCGVSGPNWRRRSWNRPRS